jgi:hypothetical protein
MSGLTLDKLNFNSLFLGYLIKNENSLIQYNFLIIKKLSFIGPLGEKFVNFSG